jgi:hypothetical protein
MFNHFGIGIVDFIIVIVVPEMNDTPVKLSLNSEGFSVGDDSIFFHISKAEDAIVFKKRIFLKVNPAFLFRPEYPTPILPNIIRSKQVFQEKHQEVFSNDDPENKGLLGGFQPR